jgi:hypothetical protein
MIVMNLAFQKGIYLGLEWLSATGVKPCVTVNLIAG